MSQDRLTTQELVAGDCCYFRSTDGRFLSFTQQNGFCLTRASSRAWFEIKETKDGRLQFRCAHGPYLCALPDGRISAARSPSGWESFMPCTIADSRLCLRSFHNTYLCAIAGSDSIALSNAPPTPDQYVELLLAFEPERYEEAIRSAKPAPKIVWTFWDMGREEMCSFHKLNLRTWHHVLGPEWRINLLSTIDGDEWHVRNFIRADMLPASFEFLPAVVKSDAVRLALLSSYGGIWMDVGIVLLRGLDEICWQEMATQESHVLLAGFFNSGWGSDHLGRRDAFENWFIAARGRNIFVDRWHRVFVDYWNDRLVSTLIGDHPLFEALDLSNFQRYGLDFRNYLTSHVAFRHVLESDPHLQRLWRNNMRLRDACDGPFVLPSCVGWQPDEIFKAMIAEYRSDLLERLLVAPLLKFTGGMASRMTGLTKDALLHPSCTMGRLYRCIFDARA
ncbi:MAG: capsular polysaccharide synthesis protein [Rhizobiaceae bacterium]